MGRRNCQLPSDARTLAVEYDETLQLLGWQQEGEAAYAQGDHSLARTFFANMLAKVRCTDGMLMTLPHCMLMALLHCMLMTFIAC